MKAWLLYEQKPIEENPLVMEEISKPEIGSNDLLVAIEYCGICRTDLHIAEGDVPLHKKPVILGHEIVGIVEKAGKEVKKFDVGDRVGISWLNYTCGKCKYCKNGKENYCINIKRTGWDVDGGFAEYTKINEDFAFDLTRMKISPADMAPLMCPGIAGYFAFKLAEAKEGSNLGLIGFGPTAYYITRVAKNMGINVFVSTRGEEHKRMAKKYAKWVGNIMEEEMPEKMDSIIFFPPAGDLVEKALENLERDGVLVLSAVSMSKIEIKDYTKNLWGRSIKTLYQVRRDYGNEFLRMVNEMNLTIPKRIFKFEELQDAMKIMKRGEFKELNAVLEI
ncbi:MAG: alcohol dehydrogenase catalytic domain-containing protein [Thermoplasmata archaeon]|nr:alcohol dehydrogenase catalytic domain-containing protein [Thermoplasmata archaeon]